jgi:hypothetical protein
LTLRFAKCYAINAFKHQQIRRRTIDENIRLGSTAARTHFNGLGAESILSRQDDYGSCCSQLRHSPPGIPPERLKMLREAYVKTMNDPELLAEANRKNFDITPSTGEELEALAKHVMTQPKNTVDRVKVLMEQ